MNDYYLKPNNSKEVDIVDDKKNITRTIYTENLNTILELENIIETLQNEILNLKTKELPEAKKEIKISNFLLALDILLIIVEIGLIFSGTYLFGVFVAIVLGTISTVALKSKNKEDLNSILKQINIKELILPKYMNDLQTLREKTRKIINEPLEKEAKTDEKTNDYSYKHIVTMPMNSLEQYIDIIPKKIVNQHQKTRKK